ncbi:isoprenylcysteine carboxylmethyltransferase family protein [Pseudophaeobacter sp.]|jgi:protein-S-isoprenylcysteine O-methyltransferase Ste14|uniref:methyltransferase family protein n=1 Tax=Pseudophaeobacter sp. TaxID=1971739 RepID=UPI00262D5EB5|nr:isoprenylcysteine carboxylmethyltransferase family protein [Pseudophaeobacter sp.]
MKWIDLPPVWLAGCIALAWAQAQYLPLGLGFGPVWADLLGGLLVGGGLVLMALAVTEMRRQKTTLMPHETPSRLVQSGIFTRSRNPIYLGDVMVLAGLILYFDAVLALPLIPVLTWILEKRFIIGEENRMRRTFRSDWARYEQKVRRWV